MCSSVLVTHHICTILDTTDLVNILGDSTVALRITNEGSVQKFDSSSRILVSDSATAAESPSGHLGDAAVERDTTTSSASEPNILQGNLVLRLHLGSECPYW